MKKVKKYTVLSWFLFLFLLVWMTSCSSRKVTSTMQKKESQIANVATTKNNAEAQQNSNVNVQKQVVETQETIVEKATYTPVDATKPSTFTDDKGNKKELDNTSYTEEKTTTKSSKKDHSKTDFKVAKTTKDTGTKTQNTMIQTIEATKEKNTQRTSLSWWWLLLLLIPLGIYLFRRWRNKIWWV